MVRVPQSKSFLILASVLLMLAQAVPSASQCHCDETPAEMPCHGSDQPAPRPCCASAMPAAPRSAGMQSPCCEQPPAATEATSGAVVPETVPTAPVVAIVADPAAPSVDVASVGRPGPEPPLPPGAPVWLRHQALLN